MFGAYRFSEQIFLFPYQASVFIPKKHALLKPQYLLLLYETKTTDLTDDA
jgi:hypothetical protein